MSYTLQEYTSCLKLEEISGQKTWLAHSNIGLAGTVDLGVTVAWFLRVSLRLA